MKSDERMQVALDLRALCCEMKRVDAELEEELFYLAPEEEGRRKAIENALKANSEKRREYLLKVDEIESLLA